MTAPAYPPPPPPPPAYWPPAPPPYHVPVQLPPRRHPWRKWSLLGCATVPVTLAAIAVLTAVTVPHDMSATPAATAPARPPSAAPQPTPDPGNTYRVTVGPIAGALADSMEATGEDCGSADLASCRADMVRLQTLTAAAIKSIHTLTVPPPFARSNALLLQALDTYQAGVALGIRGIDNQSPRTVGAGAAKLADANALLDQAAAALPP